ncbi:uncharacterized protein LOC128182555 [Crassostrea angulata]|uniref:uncharacterized protein LOC128182555 n=1 Tax=Magallana angulata TaxID=2784310 RepID=UPI0022B18670|nr:uncharacterized protein LOC128182555 [Crassostrea angulata]
MQVITVVFVISLLFWSHVVSEDSPVAKQAERRDTDLYAVSNYDKTSLYGEYNKEDECWTDGPTNPDLPVGDECQSAAVKLKIEYLLRKNPAVNEEIKEKYLHCANTYYTPYGLDNVCPSEVTFPTTVEIYGKTCYIVKPEKQCLTYVKCDDAPGCSGSTTEESKCLMSYFRDFNAWVYCENCGFTMVKLRLPQCCTCNKYEECE